MMPTSRRLVPLLWDAARYRPPSKGMVKLAVALVMAPATLLSPITMGFFVDPLWMFEDLGPFGFIAFYGLPWATAGTLIYAATTFGDRSGDAGRGK